MASNNHQQNSCPKLPSQHRSSASSDSSISSVILSMCPLSIDSDYLLEANQVKHSNGRERSNSNDQELVRSQRTNIERTLVVENEVEETMVSTPNKIKKRLSYRRLRHLLNSESSSIDSSPIATESCVVKPPLEPKLSNEIDQIETSKCSSPPSVSIQISPERLNQFKKRQTELDRAVTKLIEAVRIETTENLKQISKYWSYFKQISLEKYQPKGNPHQLFDYLLKSTNSNKRFEQYCEENDEIKAALQVLSTTLTIVHNKYSFSTINQLFDNEEQTMIENLQYQFEILLSSYTDALSLIRECIRCYQSNFNEEKNYDWIKIIQIDYPCLIEQISNDFISKIPPIEQSLIQMVRNMKKNLLNIPPQT